MMGYSVLLDLEDGNGTINNNDDDDDDDDGWKWMTSVFPPVRGMGWASGIDESQKK